MTRRRSPSWARRTSPRSRVLRRHLGLPLIERSELANVYDAGGTPIRVTRVGEPAAAGSTVLGWVVSDIGGAMAVLTAKGGRFDRYPDLAQDEDGVWTAPGGSLIAWFSDPDGNTLSLQEPPAGG